MVLVKNCLRSNLGALQKIFLDLRQPSFDPLPHLIVLLPQSFLLILHQFPRHLLNLIKYLFRLFLAAIVQIEAASLQISQCRLQLLHMGPCRFLNQLNRVQDLSLPPRHSHRFSATAPAHRYTLRAVRSATVPTSSTIVMQQILPATSAPYRRKLLRPMLQLIWSVTLLIISTDVVMIAKVRLVIICIVLAVGTFTTPLRGARTCRYAHIAVSCRRPAIVTLV